METKKQKIKRVKSLLAGADEDYTPKWWIVKDGICEDEGYPEKVHIKDTVLHMFLGKTPEELNIKTDPNDVHIEFNIN